MHLQSYEAFWINRIYHVSHGLVVDPGFHLITNAFHFDVVVLAHLKKRLGLRVQVERVEPLPARLIINAPRPAPLRRIDFHLPAIDLILEARRVEVAAGLHARVAHLAFNHQIEFQLKVAVLFLRHQKRVARVHHGSPDDGAVFHFVVGCARQSLPALQGLTIEQVLPLVGRSSRRLVRLGESQDGQDQARK